MASANVELLQAMFAGYALEGIQRERSREFFTEDVVWKAVDEAPQHGPEEVVAYLERWESEWENLQTVAEDFVEAGDRVVVTVHFSGRGRVSGAEVDARLYEVYEFRDGRIARMDEFTDRAEALALADISDD